jgi:hypothetical protein
VILTASNGTATNSLDDDPGCNSYTQGPGVPKGCRVEEDIYVNHAHMGYENMVSSEC